MSIDCHKPNLIRFFLSADRSDRPEMTLDEINEEIRKARQERKERENAEKD